MNTLAVADRERLARLLGMLGSDHAGERDNAARAAHRLVQQRGATWYDVVVTHPPPDTGDADTDPIGADWRRTPAACRRYPHLLNQWETDFLVGLPRLPRLSRKQRSALLKIVVRLRACGCAL